MISIDELRNRLISRVDELLESRAVSMRNIRYRPAVTTDKGVHPATTSEDIALLIVEHNAEFRTLGGVRQIIIEEINKLENPKQEEPETQPQGQDKEFY